MISSERLAGENEMEYRSNSENLFRRYSKILKKQNIEEENQNDF